MALRLRLELCDSRVGSYVQRRGRMLCVSSAGYVQVLLFNVMFCVLLK